MKKIFVLCGAILVAGAGYIGWAYLQPEHFGRAFLGAPAATIRQLTLAGAASGGGNVRVEGEIVRQCPVSGCWFYLDDGAGNQVKVELGKVVPTLPQRIGKRATVEGRMVLMGEEPVFAGEGVEFKR